MSDPRLNSVHLDGSRREQFRQAREHVLHARGMHTIAAERRRPPNLAEGIQRTYNSAAPLASPDDPTYCLLDRDRVYPLRLGVNVIGRASESDVVVRDAYVSRRHCAVIVHLDGGCELHDIASKNGTQLNGRQLAGPTRLHSGDEIRMCESQLVFLSRGESDSPHYAATLAG
jgi:hypothetical protein